MKKFYIYFFVLGTLFLTGCVSGERLARNTPFASGNNSFYRDGVNLFPLYYKEGKRQSILFPLIDIDDRGFAVRPFYHKDRDEHGILWPLCAFNNKGGWVGPYYWKGKENFGLLPFFIHDDEFVWVFPLHGIAMRKVSEYCRFFADIRIFSGQATFSKRMICFWFFRFTGGEKAGSIF